jgi:hypothetical protein
MNFKNAHLLFLLFLTVFLGACGKKQSVESNFDTNLIPLGTGDEIGYVDKDGKFIINPQFDEAYLFSKDGLAKVKKEGKYGFINKEGKLVVPYQFLQATSFYEGLACVVTESSAPYYINEKGEKKIELKRAEQASFFSEGFAPFSIKADGNEVWGFVNTKGEEKITPNYDEVRYFSEGLAAFRQKDKWGFLDKDGKIAINPQFAEVQAFREGFAIVKNEKGKYGAVDKSGVLKIDYQFDNMGKFSEGLAAVRSGSKWGYVNTEGKLSINPQFDQAMTFSNGVSVVEKDDKMGIIDKSGNFVANPQFKGAYIIGSSVLVDSDGKIGITDLKGKYTANPQFRTKRSSFLELIAENGDLGTLEDSKYGYVRTQAEDENEKNRIFKAIVGKNLVLHNLDCSTLIPAAYGIPFGSMKFTDNSVSANIATKERGGVYSTKKLGTYKIDTKNKLVRVKYTSQKSYFSRVGDEGSEEKTEQINEEETFKVANCDGIFALRDDYYAYIDEQQINEKLKYEGAKKEEAIEYESYNPKPDDASREMSDNRKAIYKAKSEKVYFYKSADRNTRQASFIIKGQTATALRREGEFVYVTFTYNGITTTGYMPLSDLELVDYLE